LSLEIILLNIGVLKYRGAILFANFLRVELHIVGEGIKKPSKW
jgi:hypothetical protein